MGGAPIQQAASADGGSAYCTVIQEKDNMVCVKAFGLVIALLAIVQRVVGKLLHTVYSIRRSFILHASSSATDHILGRACLVYVS